MTRTETNGEHAGANPSASDASGSLRLDVRNVGGIERASVTFDPGVTVVAGENASNKSSLLGSLGSVLGGSPPTLRGGADAGSVTLDADGERYGLDLVRRDGRTVVADATPYAPEAPVDLFVSLGEGNPLRRAVVDGGDLHDLLMRPVDTEEIEAEIDRLEARRDEIDDRLADLDDAVDDLPELEVRARRLREKRDEVAERLEETRAAIDDADYRDATEATRELLDDLKAARSERERLRERRDTKRRAVESLRDDLASVEAELGDLAPDGESVDERLDRIDEELARLRERKGRLDETINALSPIVELNRGFLAEARLPSSFDAADVIDDLDPESASVTCWTCGQAVERAAIEEQVEAVEAILQEKRRERRTVEAELEERKEERDALADRREERADLVERRRRLERGIEERERTLADLDERIEAVGDRIEELEAELDASDAAGELVDRHRDVSDLAYERGRLERELAAVEDDIEAAEKARAERDSLREERADVTARLADRRDRVERIERETVETVNECMARVLDRLSYHGIERVWIERREAEDGETTFDLQVVRTTDDGTVYRASVDTLSKSEREVVGLVIALAGYLVYDVAETVPVVVVDAIEMLDAERIRGLLDFFAEHATYVVAAALPEEAERLRERFDTVAPVPDAT